MKLGSFKRIYKTDYEAENQALVGRLAETLNASIEALYNLTNNKISLRDNMLCTVNEVVLKVDSTGTPINTTAVRLNSTSRVDGIQVIFAENQTDNTVYPSGHPFISYSQNGQTLNINNVKGLQTTYSWKLRLIVWQT